MTNKGECWSCSITLPMSDKGKEIQFKFVADGQWLHSTDLKFKDDGHSNFNNYDILSGTPI